MAEKKTTKKTAQEKPAVTRAEKKDATKNLILEALKDGKTKSNELIDKAAALYVQRFDGETENPNDVKGRVGSVLDVMKKEGEVLFDGGMYALKEETPAPQKPARGRKKKTATTEETKPQTEDKPKTKRASKKTASAEKLTEAKAEQNAEEQEKTNPLPAAPLQPIAPTAPITPETAPEPIPEDKPKKRGRKPKAVQEPKTQTKEEVKEVQEQVKETPVELKEEPKAVETELKTETKAETKEEVKEEVKAEIKEPQEEKALAPKNTVMDMSFLFGDIKPVQKRETPKPVNPVSAPKTEVKTEIKTERKPQPQTAVKAESKLTEVSAPAQAAQVTQVAQNPAPAPVSNASNTPKTENKQAESARKIVRGSVRTVNKKPARVMTAEERLQEAFLNRLRRLGGEYFEYYSVYLLERYSRQNGRRLEGLKITGGGHDGGIDGEIELTDRLGFRETIYIQSKNWDPEKGDEKLWVVGETLLQQFIGACVCRQAKEGKQHCRGIFMTTSRFTPEAKKLLQDTSDKFVGYDGTDIYEAAKECSFGLIKKNGEWALDETLLSGEKAFFNMF